MTTILKNFGCKGLTGALAMLLALLPLGESALAQTQLSNLPIASKVTAKPNILYTLDDSGSMVNNYLPDFVVNSYCRAGQSTTACSGTANFNFPPFLASDFNHLYYNPNITYTAPKKYDGSSYADENAALTTSFTKVQNDPYLLPDFLAGHVTNLTSKVSVPVYCNSDWPLVGSSYVTGDVGDANGEYKAGSGEHCRINGNAYDAVGKAPSIAADYNYPWSPSVGVGATYFYRNGGTKALYCDKTAAGWPRNLASPLCTFTCTVGVPTGGTTTVQTCNDGGQQNQCCSGYNSPAGCSGASTYSPAGCKTSTNPEYCSPGIGLPGECTAGCSCNQKRTGEKGTCSVSGASCGCTDSPPGTPCTIVVSGNANCPNVVTNPTGCTLGGTLIPSCPAAASARCTDKVWDPVAKAYTLTTLQNDAELLNGGTGTVCRHNNFDYTGIGGPAKGPVTYPTGPFTTLVNSGCPTYAGSISIPRHYYTVASVQFCQNKDTTNNDQWKGFGVAPCQAKNDLTTFLNVAYGAFTRVDLVNDGRLFNYVDPYTGVAGTRTYAQEMTNYSNWFSYYRTRVLAAKTTTSIAFSFLDKTYRIGFQGMNTPATNWVDVDDWTTGPGNQRDKWYNKLQNVAIGTGLTPSINAELRVGELFRTGTGGAGSLPTMDEGYIPATAKDPITVSCQKNYHILFTDGFTNQAYDISLGEVDGKNVPAFPADPDPAHHPEVTVAGLRALTGTPWPNPFKDPTPTANTLADVALQYWMNDLRPAASWPASIAKDNVPSNDGQAGKDLLWTNDPAFWQHVNFSAISFGSEGLLDASNTTGVTNSIASGATKWFTGVNWPNPPRSPTTPATNRGATAVDDLWHATVNARGQFVYAKDPIQVSYGLGHILAGIQNEPKSRAGSAFSSDVLTLTDHAIYVPSILPGWAGDLRKIEIDPATGVQAGAPDWSALALLDTLLTTGSWTTTPPSSDSQYPWFANRRIVTWDPPQNKAVPFLPGGIMTDGQEATLASTVSVQKAMIAYLRGGSYIHGKDTSGSDINVLVEGTAIGQFRDRSGFSGHGKLGDISDSSPLVVGNPNSPFIDGYDPGYTAYHNQYDSPAGGTPRDSRIYVGANDGMLHVFDGTTSGATSGSEVFAYIPRAVFTTATDEDGAPRGIQSLTFQDGGAPAYKHHFFVNASARKSDVDFNNCGLLDPTDPLKQKLKDPSCTPDWHTIVVGGLGKGGGSYYAIDATTPVNTTDTETNIAKKVLWEFSAADMKYSYSRPVIAKTYTDGWVVLVANGYNAPSGKGKIYMINPVTGALIRTLTTSAADETGTPGNPSGLAQISGFSKDYHNQFIEQIYGGDLNGVVWRWDISDFSPAAWTTVAFAKLTDPSGQPQPVTTAPQIEIDLNNGNDRYVFVGTGRLLHIDDLTNPAPEQIETMYAIRDGALDLPLTAGLPIAPRATLRKADPLTITPLAGAVPNGWYMDLPAGQRIVVDPEADLNVVAFIGTSTQPDPCLTSLPAYIYAREYATAESDVQVLSGGTWTTQPSAYSAEGAVGLDLIAFLDPSSSFPVLGLGTTLETTGGIATFKVQPKSFGGAHRMSWRMLGN